MYRGETENGIDVIDFNDNIDYYFYTDDTKLTSIKWKIVCYELKPGDINNNSYRRTSKFIKFVTQDILKEYDIIIWCDNKCLRELNNINISTILSCFDDNDYKMVNIIHPHQKTPQEELNMTLSYDIENKVNGQNFLNEIQEIKYDIQLPDTCFFIHTNDKATNEMLEYVFTLLETKGLKRDQNVYNHAIYECNYPAKNILMVRDPKSFLSQKDV
jgi:hypothetical protein